MFDQEPSQGDSDTNSPAIGWWLAYQVTLTLVCLAVDFDNMWLWTLYTSSAGFLLHMGCETGSGTYIVSWHLPRNTQSSHHGPAQNNTANCSPVSDSQVYMCHFVGMRYIIHVPAAIVLYQGAGLKYELGKSYKYGYDTSVMFNQHTDTQAKHKDVGFSVSSEIDLEVVFQSAEVQLYKLQIASAEVNSLLKPGLQRQLYSLLKYPILFEVSESFIEKVYTSEKESIFAANFKKGIASLFQVSTTEGSRPEIDVSGECTATYTVSGNTITKTLTDCVNLELSGQHRRSNQMLGVTVRPERNYLYDLSDGLISSATCRNKISAHVNMRPGLNTAVSQRQEIKLRAASVGSGDLKVSSTEEAVEKLGSDFGTNFGMDMLPSIQEVQQCVENCFSPASLVSKYKDVLISETMATGESARAFLDLVKSMRNVGKTTIEEIFTSEDSYYIVPQLIDVGVAAQTESGQQALMDLLNFEEANVIEYPERYLLAAAFTTHPSHNFVSSLLNLMKKGVPSPELKESLLLSLGAVIHTFCTEEENLNSPVIEEYKKAVLAELAGCGADNEVCQLMYIRSLGNAGLLDSLPVLIEYAEKGQTATVSTAALQALRRLPQDKIITQVLPVVRRMLHMTRRYYDTSVRSSALEVLLQLRPSAGDVQDIISLCTPPVRDVEFSTYVLEKLQDTAKSDTFLRHTLIEALRNIKIKNYNTFAQKGLSSAVSSYLAVTPSVNATYGLYMANSKSGLMKQSSMQVNAVGSDFSLPLLNFGLYADGIESLLGDEEGTETESGVEPTAGMSLTIMDVLLRPIEFFRGSAGLMSAVWSAPSEPMSALQANILLQDHSERLHLSNGLVVDLQILGAASIDLSGAISISLWSRNSHSQVINSGALLIEGSMKLQSEELVGGMSFSAEGGSSIHFNTDVDFYEMPLKMCLQMSRPSLVFSEKYRKFEKHKSFRKTLNVRKEKQVSVNEASFILHKYNSRQCRVLIQDE